MKKLQFAVLFTFSATVVYLSWQLHEVRSTLDETRSVLRQSEAQIASLQQKLDTLAQAEDKSEHREKTNVSVGETAKANPEEPLESRPSFAAFAARSLGASFLPFLKGSAERSDEVRAVLEERRNVAENRILSGEMDPSVVQEMALVNRILEDAVDSISIYDALAEGDARKESLRRELFRDFIEAGRYEDAAKSRPYWAMSRVFNTNSDATLSGKVVTLFLNSKQRAFRRRAVVGFAAQNIEILAGIGDVEHAIDLTARVLDYDNSPETLSLLEDHLSRVGGEDILAMLTD